MEKHKFNNLCQSSNSLFCFLRRVKKEREDVEGGRCLRRKERQLGFIEEDCAKIWKEHMEKIMNEEKEWSQMMETNVEDGSMEKVVRKEMVEAMQKMKSRKATGTFEVSVAMIFANGENGFKVMMDLCQRI